MTTGTIEIMRVYEVALTAPDGHTTTREVPLRYHPRLADLVAANSERAHDEAARRAVKRERRIDDNLRASRPELDIPVIEYDAHTLRLLRERIVPARAGRGA